MNRDPYLVPVTMIERARWDEIRSPVLRLIGSELGDGSDGKGFTNFLPERHTFFANFMSQGRDFGD